MNKFAEWLLAKNTKAGRAAYCEMTKTQKAFAEAYTRQRMQAEAIGFYDFEKYNTISLHREWASENGITYKEFAYQKYKMNKAEELRSDAINCSGRKKIKVKDLGDIQFKDFLDNT